jgi:hypothetical protein
MSLFDNDHPDFAAEVCAEAWKALDRRLMICDMALNEPDDDMRGFALRAVIEQHHRNEGATFCHPFRKYAVWSSR